RYGGWETRTRGNDDAGPYRWSLGRRRQNDSVVTRSRDQNGASRGRSSGAGDDRAGPGERDRRGVEGNAGSRGLDLDARRAASAGVGGGWSVGWHQYTGGERGHGGKDQGGQVRRGFRRRTLAPARTALRDHPPDRRLPEIRPLAPQAPLRCGLPGGLSLPKISRFNSMYSFHWVGTSSSGKMAVTGHSGSQAPQSMHSSGLMKSCFSPS